MTDGNAPAARGYPGSSDAMELADRLASMPAAEAIRGPRDWATIQSALRGVAQGATDCGKVDEQLWGRFVNHYWDSFEGDKNLVLKHVKAVLDYHVANSAQSSPDIEIKRLNGLLADAQKIIAGYQASTIARAKADVAAHGLPGARVQETPDLTSQVVRLRYAIIGYLEVFDRCGGSESVSPETFAAARQDLRDAVVFSSTGSGGAAQ